MECKVRAKFDVNIQHCALSHPNFPEAEKQGVSAKMKGKHSIAFEAFCMNQVTFALQNIKIRLWQAVKILKGYWNFITKSPRQVVFR